MRLPVVPMTFYLKRYISRSNYNKSGGQVVNESYYENWYSRHGYEVIIPESLPVYRQIVLIANAEAIATTVQVISIC